MTTSPFHRLLFGRTARRAWALLLVLLSLAIVALAMTPASQEITPDTGLDKVEHVVAFGALAWCGVLALWRRPAALSWLTAGLLLLGVGIELAQSLVPGRTASWNDIVADALGIALGLALTTVLAGALERRQTPRSDAATR